MFDTSEIFLLFEDRINKNRSFLFTAPMDRLVAENKESLNLIYEKIKYYQSKNKYLAGYFTYDYKAEFYVFDKPKVISNEELDAYFKSLNKKSYIYNFNTLIKKEEYTLKLNKIREYLKDGETYQVNFTFKSVFNFTENPLILFKSLRDKQLVEYSAYLNLNDKIFLSFSPELFLKKEKNIMISKPMKGTLKVGEKDDDYYIKQMKNDEKTISENLMIVDLIRNDFTKIAKAGTVKVENLFEVQKFKTLFQMISTVKAEVKEDIDLKEIIDALFPCGSITGAPKKRTIEIIDELEKKKRGIYTGMIGFITPENDFVFNIAIRTLEIKKGENIAEIGAGGGILYDSDIDSEWKEALLKLKFIKDLNDDIVALETVLETENGLEYEEEHLNRLNRTLKFFSINKKRIRILKKRKLPLKPKIKISKIKINQDCVFRRHKTNKRELYDNEFENLGTEYVDIVFFNKNGNLAEASRHNVYIEKDFKVYTPFIEDGALPGIIRGKLIKEGKVKEKTINYEEFVKADKIYLSNSVNGFFQVFKDESD